MLTWLLFEKVDHYQDVSAELLSNHSFTTSLDGWHSSKNVNRDQSGTIDLSNWQVADGHYIHQTLRRPASGIVRLSADALLVDVVRGPEVWHKARIDVLGRETGGPWQWDFPNTLFAETGTLDFNNISQVIQIPKAFSDIRVECELTGGKGRFLVSRISLIEAEFRYSARVMIVILMAGWILLGLYVVMTLIRRGMALTVIVMLAVCMLLLLIPEAVKQRILDSMEILDSGISVDHILLFFFSTIVILRGFLNTGIPLLQVVVSLLIFSLATEMLQYFTSHRDPLIVDGVTNIVGILIGVLAFRLIRLAFILRTP